MGLTNSNKFISTDQIDCTGSLKVTLALAAAPDISTNPTDIVLILDRSGSMAGSPLANLKLGADKFIDIIEEATDGTANGVIGSGSRIGIVSFADTAVQNTKLITSVADLKAAVNGLTAGVLPTMPTPLPRPPRCLIPLPQTPRSWSCLPTAKQPPGRIPVRLPRQPVRQALLSTASA